MLAQEPATFIQYLQDLASKYIQSINLHAPNKTPNDLRSCLLCSDDFGANVVFFGSNQCSGKESVARLLRKI